MEDMCMYSLCSEFNFWCSAIFQAERANFNFPQIFSKKRQTTLYILPKTAIQGVICHKPLLPTRTLSIFNFHSLFCISRAARYTAVKPREQLLSFFLLGFLYFLSLSFFAKGSYKFRDKKSFLRMAVFEHCLILFPKRGEKPYLSGER